MFGRSQSGPGGLSINTGSANAFGSNSSQPPPSGNKPATSLFSSVAASQPQSTQPQQSSNLFGGQSQPQQSGGIFGSSTQTGSNQQQGGSNIFGGGQNNQSTGGGLFGSQQNQQQIGGGLFGSSTAQQSQPQQGGGFFGSLGQPQAPIQYKASSLFGNTQNSAQNQPTMMQPPPPIPLFPSQIGHQGQQQAMPGVRISVNELRGTTRFNDLHEELQKVIVNVDTFIHGQIKIYEDLAGTSQTINNVSHQMGPDVDHCTKALDTMQLALENDAESIAFAKDLVKTDAADAKLSFKVIQNLKQPSQFHQNGPWATSTNSNPLTTSISGDGLGNGANRSIVDYFSKQSEEMTKSLESYRRNILEVENYLRGLESNTMQQMQQIMFSRASDVGEKSAEDQVRELAAVLREFDTGINGVAVKVGGAKEWVQGVMLGSIEDRGTRKGRHGGY